jgi:hypothetical protein
MYILIISGTVKTYPYSIGQLRKDNPNVSFPKNPTDALLASYSVFPVTATERPVYDPIMQNLSEGAPISIDGVWVQAWTVTDATQEEIAQRTSDLARSVRDTRDTLLAQSDWTQLPDSPADKPRWAAYRASLREITDQPGFPTKVVWPVL